MSTAQDFQRAIATIGLTPPETIIAVCLALFQPGVAL